MPRRPRSIFWCTRSTARLARHLLSLGEISVVSAQDDAPCPVRGTWKGLRLPEARHSADLVLWDGRKVRYSPGKTTLGESLRCWNASAIAWGRLCCWP